MLIVSVKYLKYMNLSASTSGNYHLKIVNQERGMTWEREKMGKFVLTGLFVLLITIISSGIILPGSARAEEEGYGPGTDKWKFELGAYFPAVKTNLTVGVGDQEINMEDVFGLSEDEAIWRLDGYWRFAQKHRLGFGYYRLNRDAQRGLAKEIIIDGKTWQAGALVDTDLTMDFYQLSYLYSLYQGGKWEISGLLGAYWVRAKLEFAYAAAVTNPDPPPDFLTASDRFESDTFEGPLPFLGMAFEYYITPKWLATVKGGYFQLTINDYEGKILNLGAKLEYQFTKRFGLGLGYDGFRLNVKADDGEGFAEVDYTYSGVQLFGVLRF
jgi:hypothetical protein